MSQYLKLQAEFEEKVKDLQANCPHKELTEWHFVHPDWHTKAEYKTQQCQYCGKTVKWMRPCLYCKKEIISEAGYEDGDHFFKGRWCCDQTCYRKYAEKKAKFDAHQKMEMEKALKEDRMPTIIVDEDD